MKYEFVEQAKSYLLDKIGAAPEIAIIMGSGLSAVDEILSGPQRFTTYPFPIFPYRKSRDIAARSYTEKSGTGRSWSLKVAFMLTKATRWRKSPSALVSSGD
jgi:purine nucleoside phosphorylase